MNFTEQMQADLDAIFTADEFDQEVTVNGVVVRGLVGSPGPLTDNMVSNTALTVEVRKSEVSTVAAGDSVIVDDIHYRVAVDPQSGSLTWSLELERDLVQL